MNKYVVNYINERDGGKPATVEMYESSLSNVASRLFERHGVYDCDVLKVVVVRTHPNRKYNN
jgi:hypothetical protein